MRIRTAVGLGVAFKDLKTTDMSYLENHVGPERDVPASSSVRPGEHLALFFKSKRFITDI